jgi:hypothetical protein
MRAERPRPLDPPAARFAFLGFPARLGSLAALALAVLAAPGCRSLPDGPTPVEWDHDACAKCGMHVGEPAFAAQVQLRDGRTLHYDDPGCLLLDDDATGPAVHAVWFRHHREDRWIRGDRVGFVPASPTPMGFGLGAVDAGGEALPLAAARERARREHALGLEEP